MGFAPRLCLFLLLAVSLISFCHAGNLALDLVEQLGNEKVLTGEGSRGPDGGSGAGEMKHRSLKVSDGGGGSSVEVEDYQDPSANPKHNPPPPPQ